MADVVSPQHSNTPSRAPTPSAGAARRARGLSQRRPRGQSQRRNEPPQRQISGIAQDLMGRLGQINSAAQDIERGILERQQREEEEADDEDAFLNAGMRALGISEQGPNSSLPTIDLILPEDNAARETERDAGLSRDLLSTLLGGDAPKDTGEGGNSDMEQSLRGGAEKQDKLGGAIAMLEDIMSTVQDIISVVWGETLRDLEAGMGDGLRSPKARAKVPSLTPLGSGAETAAAEPRQTRRSIVDGAATTIPIRRFSAKMLELQRLPANHPLELQNDDAIMVRRMLPYSFRRLRRLQAELQSQNEKNSLWGTLLHKKDQQLVLVLKREDAQVRQLRNKIEELNSRVEEDHRYKLDSMINDTRGGIKLYNNERLMEIQREQKSLLRQFRQTKTTDNQDVERKLMRANIQEDKNRIVIERLHKKVTDLTDALGLQGEERQRLLDTCITTEDEALNNQRDRMTKMKKAFVLLVKRMRHGCVEQRKTIRDLKAIVLKQKAEGIHSAREGEYEIEKLAKKLAMTLATQGTAGPAVDVHSHMDHVEAKEWLAMEKDSSHMEVSPVSIELTRADMGLRPLMRMCRVKPRLRPTQGNVPPRTEKGMMGLARCLQTDIGEVTTVLRQKIRERFVTDASGGGLALWDLDSCKNLSEPKWDVAELRALVLHCIQGKHDLKRIHAQCQRVFDMFEWAVMKDNNSIKQDDDMPPMPFHDSDNISRLDFHPSKKKTPQTNRLVQTDPIVFAPPPPPTPPQAPPSPEPDPEPEPPPEPTPQAEPEPEPEPEKRSGLSLWQKKIGQAGTLCAQLKAVVSLSIGAGPTAEEDEEQIKEETDMMSHFTGLLDRVFTDAEKEKLSDVQAKQLAAIRNQVQNLMQTWEDFYQAGLTEDEQPAEGDEDSLPDIDPKAGRQKSFNRHLRRTSSLSGIVRSTEGYKRINPRQVRRIEEKSHAKWEQRRKDMAEERMRVLQQVMRVVEDSGGQLGDTKMEDISKTVSLNDMCVAGARRGRKRKETQPPSHMDPSRGAHAHRDPGIIINIDPAGGASGRESPHSRHSSQSGSDADDEDCERRMSAMSHASASLHASQAGSQRGAIRRGSTWAGRPGGDKEKGSRWQEGHHNTDDDKVSQMVLRRAATKVKTMVKLGGMRRSPSHRPSHFGGDGQMPAAPMGLNIGGEGTLMGVGSKRPSHIGGDMGVSMKRPSHVGGEGMGASVNPATNKKLAVPELLAVSEGQKQKRLSGLPGAGDGKRPRLTGLLQVPEAPSARPTSPSGSPAATPRAGDSAAPQLPGLFGVGSALGAGGAPAGDAPGVGADSPGGEQAAKQQQQQEKRGVRLKSGMWRGMMGPVVAAGAEKMLRATAADDDADDPGGRSGSTLGLPQTSSSILLSPPPLAVAPSAGTTLQSAVSHTASPPPPPPPNKDTPQQLVSQLSLLPLSSDTTMTRRTSSGAVSPASARGQISPTAGGVLGAMGSLSLSYQLSSPSAGNGAPPPQQSGSGDDGARRSKDSDEILRERERAKEALLARFASGFSSGVSALRDGDMAKADRREEEEIQEMLKGKLTTFRTRGRGDAAVKDCFGGPGDTQAHLKKAQAAAAAMRARAQGGGISLMASPSGQITPAADATPSADQLPSLLGAGTPGSDAPPLSRRMLSSGAMGVGRAPTGPALEQQALKKAASARQQPKHVYANGVPKRR